MAQMTTDPERLPVEYPLRITFAIYARRLGILGIISLANLGLLGAVTDTRLLALTITCLVVVTILVFLQYLRATRLALELSTQMFLQLKHWLLFLFWPLFILIIPLGCGLISLLARLLLFSR